MAATTGAHAVLTPEILAEMAAETSLCMFLVGSYTDGLPLLWVNKAFEQRTGITAGAEPARPVPGRVSLGPLERLLVDPSTGSEAVPAMASGEGGTFTMECRGRDGETYWSHATFTPRRDESGRVTHFLGVSVDVSAYVDERSAQLRTLAVERRQRADLDLIAQTTELLGDLEYPYALRDIAELLRTVVPWAAFYLNDDGLLYAEGIDISSPPGGRGRRHVRHVRYVVDAELDAGLDVLEPGHGTEAVDAVQDLLDGLVDGPVLVRLDVEYPPFSASGWLRRDLVRRVIEETGVRPGSVVVHAVGGRRQVLGLLVTWNGDQAGAAVVDDPFAFAPSEPDDVQTVVEVVARRAGTAIDNARLYAREHRLAEALQRAMLPEQADVTGLDVWTYYAPTAEHAQVGGDWYDVLEIGKTVGLVIGDVVGHDVEAAAAMGQLRSVVRSYAYELTTPGVVLDRVDTLVQGMRIPRSASLVYATLRRRAGEDGEIDPRQPESWDMEYTRAGHLPPLLVRQGEVRQLDGGGGSLVGFGLTERQTAYEVLVPGDVLLFYTDGLIERRDRSLKVGLEALTRTASRITARDAAGVGEELLSRLADAPEDDVAIVVVRLPDPVADAEAPALSPRSRRWLLPSEPASIGRARHAVLRSCQAWGLADSASAELVVSELVANGVLHGWGNISLRLFDTGEGLRIEVEDANPAPPVTTDGHPNRVGGFGMQIVERLADWGWRPAGSGKLVWAKLKQPVTSAQR